LAALNEISKTFKVNRKGADKKVTAVVPGVEKESKLGPVINDLSVQELATE
jgi:hypothetical protein